MSRESDRRWSDAHRARWRRTQGFDELSDAYAETLKQDAERAAELRDDPRSHVRGATCPRCSGPCGPTAPLCARCVGRAVPDYDLREQLEAQRIAPTREANPDQSEPEQAVRLHDWLCQAQAAQPEPFQKHTVLHGRVDRRVRIEGSKPGLGVKIRCDVHRCQKAYYTFYPARARCPKCGGKARIRGFTTFEV